MNRKGETRGPFGWAVQYQWESNDPQLVPKDSSNEGTDFRLWNRGSLGLSFYGVPSPIEGYQIQFTISREMAFCDRFEH